MTTERASRRDLVRNRRKLLDVTEALLQGSDPAQVTMPQIAEASELSVATAYRHFPALEDLFGAVIHRVVLELEEFASRSPLQGEELFDATVAKWVELVETHGRALVQIRSRRGLLQRLDAQDAVVLSVKRAWERPLVQLMSSLDIQNVTTEEALYFCNVLLDPREILDLIYRFGNVDHILHRIHAAYREILRSWDKSGS